jgi:hypothetical protein
MFPRLLSVLAVVGRLHPVTNYVLGDFPNDLVPPAPRVVLGGLVERPLDLMDENVDANNIDLVLIEVEAFQCPADGAQPVRIRLLSDLVRNRNLMLVGGNSNSGGVWLTPNGL